MLALNDQLTRRAALRVGALGLGGLSLSQVIGQSTRDGGEPAVDPYNTDNLVGTIMNALFNFGEMRLARGLPSDVVRFVSSGDPIRGLF